MNFNYLLELIDDLRTWDSEKEAVTVNKITKLKSDEIELIIDNLLNDPNDDINFKALDILKELDNRNIEYTGSALIKLLDHKNNLIRSEALDAISRLSRISSLEKVLILAEKDPDWLVRASAIETLAVLADTENLEALDVVIRILEDEHYIVRSYAVWAFGILGTSTLLPVLTSFLNTETDEIVRANAWLAKFYLGDNNAIAAFIKILDRADSDSISPLLNILEELFMTKDINRIQCQDVLLLKESLSRIIKINSYEANHIKKLLGILDTLEILR